MVFKNTMRVCLSMDDACRLPSAPASLKVVLSGTEAWVHENEQPDGLAAAAAARCSSWASVSSSARVSFRTQMSLRCVVIIQLVVPSRGGRMTPRNVDGKLVYPPPSRDSREVIT